MSLEDKQTRRLVEREVFRHSIDYSLLVVAVINGVCTFHGRVSPLRGTAGHKVDVRDEMRKVRDGALSIRGVNDVVLDVSYDM